MENRAARARQSMLLEISFAETKPADFQKFWEELPRNIQEYVRGLEENEKGKIFEMASKRVNEAKMPVVREGRLRDALNATIAGEIYAVIGKIEDADLYFHKTLELLREDKIRERKAKS